jgi:hypothetical protein
MSDLNRSVNDPPTDRAVPAKTEGGTDSCRPASICPGVNAAKAISVKHGKQRDEYHNNHSWAGIEIRE